MLSIAVIFGTRPEAIKLAPLIRLLRADGRFELTTLSTGQHGEMLDVTLKALQLTPDISLQVLRPGQDLAHLTSRALTEISDWLGRTSIEQVIVHGDTTSAAAGALAAFYSGLEAHHVEAGLRTRDLNAPFPEEFNRQLIARVATKNYAPTEFAKKNLLLEGVRPERISVTGNTVVESLSWMVRQNGVISNNIPDLASRLQALGVPFLQGSPTEFALVTLHRRENQGLNFSTVLDSLRTAAERHPGFHFIFPVHPNPIISLPVRTALDSCKNVHLIEPLDYEAFSFLLARCSFILSDSGGIQEEAVTLGKKVILARVDTERPEGLQSGHVLKPEMKSEEFLDAMETLIASRKESQFGINTVDNPFGDGKASERILASLAGEHDVKEFVYG